MPLSSVHSKTSRQKDLRRGWTTGACATAASVAAYYALSDTLLPRVEILLPRQGAATLPIAEARHIPANTFLNQRISSYARASVTKDAGDDPDCTHAARIWVRLEQQDKPGLVFLAGKGVGTVRQNGLHLKVGEPAINPAPRQMILQNLEHHGWNPKTSKGLKLTIGIRNGEHLAQQTWNPRLGIQGGLSILGTSGIVIPYSCSAWLASIKLGIRVAIKNNTRKLSAATGRTSLYWLEQQGYAQDAIIDMGDFALGVCKQLRRYDHNRWDSLHVAGGIGKLCKLAQGAGDLHNQRSSVKWETMRQWICELNGNPDAVLGCQSINQLFLREPRIAQHIADKARDQIHLWLKHENTVTVSVIDRNGQCLATTRNPGDTLD